MSLRMWTVELCTITYLYGHITCIYRHIVFDKTTQITLSENNSATFASVTWEVEELKSLKAEEFKS